MRKNKKRSRKAALRKTKTRRRSPKTAPLPSKAPSKSRNPFRSFLKNTSPLLLAFEVLVLLGVGAYVLIGGDGEKPGPKVHQLSSGAKIKVFYSGMRPTMTGRDYLVRYETRLKDPGPEALRAEADQVLKDFLPQVERSGMKDAVMAIERPPVSAVPGPVQLIEYSFRKDDKGEWRFVKEALT